MATHAIPFTSPSSYIIKMIIETLELGFIALGFVCGLFVGIVIGSYLTHRVINKVYEKYNLGEGKNNK